jgi:hypothetical protein
LRTKPSLLQARIMLKLEQGEVSNLTKLAKQLDVFRSSVSRAIHQLKGQGLVNLRREAWMLTETGEAGLPTARIIINEAHKNSFKPAAHLTYQWFDCTTSFDCSCGVTEIIISDSGEIKRCECGREYKLVAYVAMSQREKF